jgi:hypothetical protein
VKISKVIFIRPEADRSNYEQVNEMDRTRECCKILRGFVIRGERLIKISDSWFSAKII